MNAEIINALYGYITVLLKLNQKLIKLCGIDVIINFEESKIESIDIIQEIPRVIPYSVDNKTNEICFQDNDGLLEFDNELNFLKSEYRKIADDNKDSLLKIKHIRNKYEHKVHAIKFRSASSGSSSYFDFIFSINEDEIKITAEELIKIVKSINLLFDRILSLVRQYAYNTQNDDHPYYRRLSRVSFEKFNKIYDSNILREIGECLHSF